MPRYRIQVQFDAGRGVFVARAPELPPSSAEGASRAEALARLEEAIEAQVATIADQGGVPPRAVDELEAPSETSDEGNAPGRPGAALGAGAGQIDGRVAARVTPALHRELLYQARAEGLPLDVLVAELLAESLALRSARELRLPRGPRRSDGDRGNDRGGERGNRRGEREERPRGPGYNEIMESSSSFLQYVRGLEQGGDGSRGGGGGGYRGGGGNRGGGGGGGNRGGGNRGP